MFLRGIRRIHVQSSLLAQVEKSALAKLRKKTGFAISNCKKALELNDSDIQKATIWLQEQAQKEGWAKAEKLQGRKTAQGLVGILLQKKIAAMVEVNCETDFVSKNREFLNLVSSIALVCHAHADHCCSRNSGNLSKLSLDRNQLMALPWKDSDKTLADLVALKIGQIGENMTLHRAICYQVADHLELGCYAHPITEESTRISGFFHGKYGALLAFEKSEVSREEGGVLTSEQCGRQLSQHIIGMNPQTVGEITEEPLENKEDESRLVHQEYLADPLVTVADFLQQHGIQVLDFARYECGETCEDKE